MPDFLPLTVKFPGSRPILISNVAEAAATLSKTWPDRTNAAYVNAASLLSKAIAGTCRPKVAFEAYRIAAGRQGLLLDGSRSAALHVLDALCRELVIVPPEV